MGGEFQAQLVSVWPAETHPYPKRRGMGFSGLKYYIAVGLKTYSFVPTVRVLDTELEVR